MKASTASRFVPGTIYVAPGGRHMQVIKRDNGIFIALDDGPLVNYCRPAVDPLFYSAAAAWGPAALALILTGMGSDGAKGGAEHRRPWRQRHRAGRGVQRGVGHAGCGGACGNLLGRASARPDRAQESCVCFPESVSDPIGLRLPAQAPQGALGPRALRRQAVSGRKPAAADRAQDRRAAPRRPGGQAQGARRRAAHRRRGRGDDDQRIVLLPRQDPVRSFPRGHACRA